MFNDNHDENDIVKEFNEYFDLHPELNNTDMFAIKDKEHTIIFKIWRNMTVRELKDEFIKGHEIRELQNQKNRSLVYLIGIRLVKEIKEIRYVFCTRVYIHIHTI